MSEKKFWRTTPARLNALSVVHTKIAYPTTQTDSTDKVANTVEEALAMGLDI